MVIWARSLKPPTEPRAINNTTCVREAGRGGANSLLALELLGPTRFIFGNIATFAPTVDYYAPLTQKREGGDATLLAF